MRRLDIESLDGFNETLIDVPAKFDVTLEDGRTLEYEQLINNIPAVTGSYDGLAGSYERDRYPEQMVLSYDAGLEEWDPKEHYRVKRFAPIHGRNLELMAGKILVEDEFGNEFYSVCIKGSDMSAPLVFSTDNPNRKYCMLGMQESVVMERVLRTSKLFRENEIPTEYICGLAVPNYFPAGLLNTEIDTGELLELPELVLRGATHYAYKGIHPIPPLPPPPTNPPASPVTVETKFTLPKDPLKIRADVLEYLADSDYLVSIRAMPTPYRLSQLSSPDEFEEFRNYVIRVAGEEDPDEVEEFKDISYNDYMIRMSAALGMNVGRMHKLGIRHGYLYSLNLGATGAIVDLDSCKGERLGLGDEPTLFNHELSDVREAVAAISDTMKSYLFYLMDDDAKHIQLLEDLYYAHLSFLNAYLNEFYEDEGDRPSFLVGYMNDGLIEDATNGIDVSRRFILVDGVGRLLVRSLDESNVRLPEDTAQIKYDKADFALKSLPPKAISELKDRFLKQDWVVKHVKLSEDNVTPVHVPISAKLDSMLMAQVAINAEQDKSFDPFETLKLMRCVISVKKDVAVDKFSEEDKEMVRQYLDRIRQQISTTLENPNRSKMTNKLANFFDEKAEGLAESFSPYLGKYSPVESGVETDVLYLKPEEIEATLKLFGAEADTPIRSTSKTPRKLFAGDSVLIADYDSVVPEILNLNHKNPLNTILAGGSHAKPVICITGLKSGKHEFYVIDEPVIRLVEPDRSSIDEFPNSYSMYQLVDYITGKATKFRQDRLFNPSEYNSNLSKK
jgi:hypothetical protein